MSKCLLYTGYQALDAALWNGGKTNDFFQSPGFLSLWQNMPAFEPWLIQCRSKDRLHGWLNGVLMRNPLLPYDLSSRFIAWGGPVILPGDDPIPITASIIDCLKAALPKGLVYAEIRGFLPNPSLSAACTQAGLSFLPYTGLRIDLSEGDPISRIRPSRLRQARQASEAGVLVQAAHNEDAVMAWYRMMRRRYWQIRKPLPPAAFFLRFFQDTQKKGIGEILLATHKEEIIGGLMLAGDVLHGRYLWYTGGRRKAGKASSPMTLLYTEAIRLCHSKGTPFLDLMGGGLETEPSGRSEYKMSFGPTLSLPGRYILIRRPAIYALGKYLVRS